jgi:hypothetical protein
MKAFLGHNGPLSDIESCENENTILQIFDQ